jgi:hypothetical protein
MKVDRENTRIKSGMVALWIGSEHMNTKDLLHLLTELINEDYSIEDFKEDVWDFPCCEDHFEDLNHD